MKQFKQLVAPDIIEQVFALYRNSTNQVEVDGQLVDRHTMGNIGMFMLSRFTEQEFRFLWDHIKDNLQEKYDLAYCRVLKYTQGCHIPQHVDSYISGEQKVSDTSLIIQLNSHDSFRGGLPSVHGNKQYLEPGDAILYHYGELHDVSPVSKGIRYVANLRLRKNDVG
jgi:predicted 2-oxoglutarate/Fe(II)-dependent dioxygenase YbiX